MNSNQGYVQIIQMDEELLELRYFETCDSERYLAWQISVPEGRDLAMWWKKIGASLNGNEFPIRDMRFHSLLISMHTPSLVEVRGLDSYGRKKSLGWTFPTSVVADLVSHMAREQLLPT